MALDRYGNIKDVSDTMDDSLIKELEELDVDIKDKMMRAFSRGKINGYEYFGVAIATKGLKEPELIINPMCNIEFKISYYDKAYTDSLEHKNCKDIRINRWAVGNTIEEVASNLI